MFGKKPNIDNLILALGNPGEKYSKTRHNAGFIAADYITKQLGITKEKKKFSSLYRESSINSNKIILAYPQTYMNLSGDAANSILSFYKIPVGNLIVLHDETAIPLGKIRINVKGSDGGHNGIKDIIKKTGTQEFIRIRIGIGAKPHPDYILADYVLSKFSADELKTIENVCKDIYGALEMILEGKTEQAMNKYN